MTATRPPDASGPAAYRHSRTSGLHAVIAGAREYAQSDQMLYRGIAAYLNAVYLSDETG